MAQSHLQPPQPLPRSFYEPFLCTGLKLWWWLLWWLLRRICRAKSAWWLQRGGLRASPGDTGTAAVGIPKECEDADFSCHQIGDEGVRAIMQVFLKSAHWNGYGGALSANSWRFSVALESR